MAQAIGGFYSLAGGHIHHIMACPAAALGDLLDERFDLTSSPTDTSLSSSYASSSFASRGSAMSDVWAAMVPPRFAVPPLPAPTPAANSAGASSASQHQPDGPLLVVFSGGTAFNSVAGHVRHLTTRVAYVLPVSDDGGSTAEIVRVLGGPAVGDIRSRCLRLADDSDEEARAVRRLLAYRLSGHSGKEAKAEWYQIVEGEHPLWEVGAAGRFTVEEGKLGGWMRLLLSPSLQGVSEPLKHTPVHLAYPGHSHVSPTCPVRPTTHPHSHAPAGWERALQ